MHQPDTTTSWDPERDAPLPIILKLAPPAQPPQPTPRPLPWEPELPAAARGPRPCSRASR